MAHNMVTTDQLHAMRDAEFDQMLAQCEKDDLVRSLTNIASSDIEETEQLALAVTIASAIRAEIKSAIEKHFANIKGC